MPPISARHESQVYAITRVVTGFLFTCHGLQKVLGLFGGLGGHPAPLFSLPWVAGVIELVGGLLVALGLLTRWAAFICSGEMAVAYFMMHQRRGLVPIANQGELAALFAFVFLLIAARGPGPWSLDATRGASAAERR